MTPKKKIEVNRMGLTGYGTESECNSKRHQE